MMTCKICGDDFSIQEVAEFILSGEPFNLRPFICPDCFDDITRLDLEEQLAELLKEAEAKVHGEEVVAMDEENEPGGQMTEPGPAEK